MYAATRAQLTRIVNRRVFSLPYLYYATECNRGMLMAGGTSAY